MGVRKKYAVIVTGGASREQADGIDMGGWAEAGNETLMVAPKPSQPKE
jgi:hypothetical protein